MTFITTSFVVALLWWIAKGRLTLFILLSLQLKSLHSHSLLTFCEGGMKIEVKGTHFDCLDVQGAIFNTHNEVFIAHWWGYFATLRGCHCTTWRPSPPPTHETACHQWTIYYSLPSSSVGVASYFNGILNSLQITSSHFHLEVKIQTSCTLYTLSFMYTLERTLYSLFPLSPPLHPRHHIWKSIYPRQ